ncbi:AP-3 complex subunit sigma-2 [Saguinus oedipus]|uniref:AP-3 complex subunit sigma-2 n=1 Tax=Saguinus oedipus TaxID=9490 RepID=A0ABQ9VDN9_SAGOE|nr:AP-3 complex subunit sigma-2 [Saguinus oedipus]
MLHNWGTGETEKGKESENMYMFFTLTSIDKLINPFRTFIPSFPEEIQQQIVRETFHLVLKRDDNICNFLEGGSLIGGSDYKLIYRHYATLYFVFCVDSSESELGILDLIQLPDVHQMVLWESS